MVSLVQFFHCWMTSQNQLFMILNRACSKISSSLKLSLHINENTVVSIEIFMLARSEICTGWRALVASQWNSTREFEYRIGLSGSLDLGFASFSSTKTKGCLAASSKRLHIGLPCSSGYFTRSFWRIQCGKSTARRYSKETRYQWSHFR